MKEDLEIPVKVILGKIYWIRGQKIMLDKDLAELYGVEIKQLKRQVRRNLERFYLDFMYEMESNEHEILRSQIGTSRWGGTRHAPMAFMEQGVAMLSSVLNSPKAIKVNIQIIGVFTKNTTDFRGYANNKTRNRGNQKESLGSRQGHWTSLSLSG
ncbi:ORF6N domain-containing protein [Pricia sp. S334]|uniref:ORF6N domain-containing protein n=1 Tax=Pricia mediterranea TaxID=3076079 RepID=A0ABU3L5G1_9FLAO|nr:ORF6N domain-containing protein [Pricia sp. S334]MDT7828613.1 ORF6N domain-containing protein [Pricia sp. S334]